MHSGAGRLAPLQIYVEAEAFSTRKKLSTGVAVGGFFYTGVSAHARGFDPNFIGGMNSIKSIGDAGFTLAKKD